MNKTGEIRTIEPSNLQRRSGFYRDGFHVEAWIAAEAAPMGCLVFTTAPGAIRYRYCALRLKRR